MLKIPKLKKATASQQLVFSLTKTKDIQIAINLLQQAGTKVDINCKVNWAHRHSSTAGNEEADRMAKEAEQEASVFPTGSKMT